MALSTYNAAVGSAQAGKDQLGWADDVGFAFQVAGEIGLSVAPAAVPTVPQQVSDYNCLVGRTQAGYAELGWAWDRAFLAVVMGTIGLAIALPQPQGVLVSGAVNLSVVKVTGAILLYGSFNCAGAVGANFQPSKGSFGVIGEIEASFLQNGGQQESCISGPDTPAAGRPNNAVH